MISPEQVDLREESFTGRIGIDRRCTLHSLHILSTQLRHIRITSGASSAGLTPQQK
jgi:hypothetical protein